MRKIFTFAALMFAAVSMNAEITEMTCAEAKAAALELQNGQTGTDSVAVTGFVTYTNGTVSRGQQTFWLDDQKGNVQTFQAYWCNLPDDNALNVGDKVIIRGFLMNYNGTTAEMKNGDTEVLERVVILRDTFPSTVCEVYEEGDALSDREMTDDYFVVEAVVSSIQKAMNEYGQESFWMECDSNTAKQVQAYNIIMANNEAAEIGDKVSVIGRIQKYGTTIELINGTATVLEKGQVVIDTIRANVAEAVAAGRELENGKTSMAVYIVEGYADSIAFAFSEEKKNMSFYMCDDMANPTYDFEAYKVSTETEITLGMKVWIVGHLYHYYRAEVIDEEHPENNKPEINLIEISEGKAYLSDPQGVDNVADDVKAVKRIENGQLIIIRGDKRFNALGTPLAQ